MLTQILVKKENQQHASLQNGKTMITLVVFFQLV